jgi:hypothetical protein
VKEGANFSRLQDARIGVTGYCLWGCLFRLDAEKIEGESDVASLCSRADIINYFEFAKFQKSVIAFRVSVRKRTNSQGAIFASSA